MAEELDETTLTRARAGEPRALTALVELYGPRVHALVCRMLVGQPRATAEDLCQESLVRVIRALPGFDPGGPARLSTWILTVATRACIDHLRRSGRRQEHPLDAEAVEAAADSPERRAGQRELRARVERVMAQLPHDQRAVLVLRAYHDLDYDEIARTLGIEVGTVKSRLGRARLALRRVIAETKGAA